MTYFNEFAPYPAAWLRSLYPTATVDERSISDITEAPHPRSHFFAGIGGWEHALTLARWPLDRPVWTGSCPCQPFSVAGRQKGTSDARHLWPEFLRLIEQHRPPTIFGEQVASRLGREWLAGVRSDLETLGYDFGAADLCAAGVGAPHIRARLWWVANARRERDERWGGLGDLSGAPADPQEQVVAAEGRDNALWERERGGDAVGDCGAASNRGLAQSECDSRREGWTTGEPGEGTREKSSRASGELGRSGLSGPWSQFEWAFCLDGKSRRLEPGLVPLAHGIPERTPQLRAYGNAIVPQVAATFIKAFLAAEQDLSR